MNSQRIFLRFSGVLLLLPGLIAQGFGQWSTRAEENNAIAVVPGSAQSSPVVVADGERGALVIWVDDRNGDRDVYGQRIDEQGNALWAASGLPLIVAANDQQAPAVILKNPQQFAMAWQDERKLAAIREIYLQVFSLENGAPVWTQEVPVQQGNNTRPFLTANGTGLTTASFTSGLFDDVISVQFTDANGLVSFTPQQIINPFAKGRQVAGPPPVVSALSGGLIAAWIDARNDTSLFVTGMEPSGDVWLKGEMALSPLVKPQENPAVVADGQQGAIAVWIAPGESSGSDDILASRLSASGEPVWAKSISKIPTTAGRKRHLKTVVDSHDNLFVVWQNNDGFGEKLYLQQIELSGASWVADVKIADSAGAQKDPELISTNANAILVLWQEEQNGQATLAAQMFDATGATLWTEAETLVSTSFSGTESAVKITGDGLGGIIAVWQDQRNGDADIYAQRLNVEGTLGEFRSVTLEALRSHNWEIGGPQTIAWRSTSGIDSVRLELSRDDGGTYETLLSVTSNIPGQLNQAVIGSVTGPVSESCKLRVVALPSNFIFAESEQFSISAASGPVLATEKLPDAVWGDSLLVTSTATDISGVQTVRLYFKKGGAPRYDVREMAAADTTAFRGVVPASVVTERGLTYFVAAEDSLGHVSFSDTFFVHVRFPVGTETRSVHSGQEQNTYRMFSAPNNLDERSLMNLLTASGFGSLDTTRYRIFQYRNGQHVELDSAHTATFQIAPGEAFWIISAQNRVLDFGSGRSLSADSSFVLTLEAGWNQIANPFAFPISWDAVLAQNPGVALSSPFVFQGGYQMAEILVPYEGYFVFNQEATRVSLSIPATEDSSAAALQKQHQAGWQIQIAARCQKARDAANFFGIHPEAQSAWDRLDQPEPPVIGRFIAVQFPHADWTQHAGNYTTEFRPDVGTGQIWELQVITNVPNASAELVFKNLEQLPRDLSVQLFDPLLKTKQDLRSNSTFAFETGKSRTEKMLQVFVGSNAFISQALSGEDVIPDDFELSQNFPNPFNPATSIRFGLPQTAKVSLSVYDILGQRVRTLLDNVQQPAGFHVVRWDGTDNRQRQVASGIYFYRIHSDNFVRTRKMLLVH